MKAVAASGDEGMIKLFLATHTGMTEEQFEETASAWLATAEQPRSHRLYTQCVYQPMLKLLAYLRANRFKTYIVSGGGQDFMRPFTQKVYGVPPEQVVGTQFKSQYMLKVDSPSIELLPRILSIDDGPGKPEKIQRFIGKKPIAAFGNSDGDFQMLEWTGSNTRPNLELLVHHTDAVRAALQT
jgi:hypothetical protein